MTTNQISLKPTAIIRVLGLLALLLILASMAGQAALLVFEHEYVEDLANLVYVNSERNFPTYYSVLLMLYAALLLSVIAIASAQHSAPDVSKWAILSFGFVFMAFDEGFQFHERFNLPVRALLGDGNLGVLHYAWVVPGAALVLVLAIFFMGFLWRLPVPTRRTFLIAGMLYIGGAIGTELFGGRYAELHGNENWTYSMLATLEESLEMAGLIVFISGLLQYCAAHYPEVRFRFER